MHGPIRVGMPRQAPAHRPMRVGNAHPCTNQAGDAPEMPTHQGIPWETPLTQQPISSQNRYPWANQHWKPLGSSNQCWRARTRPTSQPISMKQPEKQPAVSQSERRSPETHLGVNQSEGRCPKKAPGHQPIMKELPRKAPRHQPITKELPRNALGHEPIRKVVPGKASGNQPIGEQLPGKAPRRHPIKKRDARKCTQASTNGDGDPRKAPERRPTRAQSPARTASRRPMGAQRARRRPMGTHVDAGGGRAQLVARQPLPGVDARLDGLQRRQIGLAERHRGAGLPAGARPGVGHRDAAAP